MPVVNAPERPTTRVIERAALEACIDIARRVHRARKLLGDDRGADAARQVAWSILEELLEPGSERRPVR